MAEYVIQLNVTTSSEVDARELQVGLSSAEGRRRLSDLVASALILPHVPEGTKYPKAGTFVVGSVNVERKK